MIDGAISLLARRGLQGTSFAEVLTLTGAPRGSIYHHFPGGKDELVACAIDASTARAVQLLDRLTGAPALDVAQAFVETWRTILTRSRFEAGCALVAVTVAAEPGELRERTAAAFLAWRDKLGELLAAGGVPAADASARAASLLAACEGAVVISRATRNTEVFEQVTAIALDDLAQAVSSPA
jgi:AcrR family transcriptional regulator